MSATDIAPITEETTRRALRWLRLVWRRRESDDIDMVGIVSCWTHRVEEPPRRPV